MAAASRDSTDLSTSRGEEVQMFVARFAHELRPCQKGKYEGGRGGGACRGGGAQVYICIVYCHRLMASDFILVLRGAKLTNEHRLPT